MGAHSQPRRPHKGRNCACKPRLSHARLAKLIGEIDRVSLRTIASGSPAMIGVFVTIGAHEVELIRDLEGGRLDHAITRSEVGKCLACAGVA